MTDVPGLEQLEPIPLEALDERSALLRRVDVKYVLDLDSLAELISLLASAHDVLEVDGRRLMAYESVYFDTADLRSFHEHVGDVRPRWKARTRRYVDTDTCVFEVKVKDVDGNTDKRQTEHRPEDAATVTDDARRLVDETLAEAGIEPPGPLATTLITSFGRFTLAARDVAARVTVDLGVELRRVDGGALRLRPELAIVETKSEDGESPADQGLMAVHAKEMSLSKYRVGVDTLHRGGRPDAVEELFE